MKPYPDKTLKVDQHPPPPPPHHHHHADMVEKAPPYPCHMTFEAVPPVGLLSSMGPFLNADVTNPRELYSILSDSRHAQGSSVAAASVEAVASAAQQQQQQTLRLPPLQSSTASEISFRPLREQTQHNSYPDLSSLSRQQGTQSQLDSVRRSTSLQDVSSVLNIDGVLTSRKLTPIPRSCDTKTPREQAQEKGEEKGEKAEGQLIKDRPLPPIEGKGDVLDAKGAVSTMEGGRLRNGDEANFQLYHNSHSHRRSTECPNFIFPRGQPTQVKKPATPTYDDYPEAYWELRSPTLQEPGDLKEDMIDRDFYRLQQISMHHLRAMNRDVMMNRLDSYRKWQQKMQEHLPPLALANRQDVSRDVGVWPGAHNGPLMSDRSWRPHRTAVAAVPVQNHTMILAPKTIVPSNNPAIKKHNDRLKNAELDDVAKQADPGAMAEAKQQPSQENREGMSQQQENPQTKQGETDAKQRKKLKPNRREKDQHKHEETKPLKASVVNLFMDPTTQSNVAVSDMHTVLRKRHAVRRPHSVKVGPYQYEEDDDFHQNGHVENPARLMSAVSNNDTASSSLSHYLQRLPSAPAATPPPTLRTLPFTNRDREHIVTVKEKHAGGRMILNKFNRLQVFGEKGHANGGGSGIPYTTVATSQRKKVYLPQNRPPTYRLDLRNYPPRPPGSDDHDLSGREVRVNMEVGGYPILVSERGGMPIVQHPSEQIDPASLSFRFRDGEVIVSRQGKKSYPT